MVRNTNGFRDWVYSRCGLVFLVEKYVRSHSYILPKRPHGLLCHNELIICVFYRAHIGRRPKTFWSWWCLARPASSFLMMCSALTAQNRAALQKSPLRAYSTTPPRSCLAKLWISTLTSQRSVSFHSSFPLSLFSILLLTGIICLYRHRS